MNNHTVIIPTAGLGSRIGELTKKINKALLPFVGKPVLSHIIDKFPQSSRFIIAVGYKADQVKDFCRMAYPDHNIHFVEIDDYTSTSSGPGYTALKCMPLINGPFWYIPCDTYFNEDISTSIGDCDTVFVKRVNQTLSHLYTMFQVENGLVNNMTFKQPQPESWMAFTGVMYIHDWSRFKERLATLPSPEIIWTIQRGTIVSELSSWLDFGNFEIYSRANAESQRYDFTKPDELTYICGGRVVKWWDNPKIAEQKWNRTRYNPPIFPDNCQWRGSWLGYNYFTGKVLYDCHDIDLFKKMLTWFEHNVWLTSGEDITAQAHAFYYEKTIDRVNKFLEKYPEIEDVDVVNGVKVNGWHTYFDNIDWKLLTGNLLPGFIHGDLQFDNIVVDASDQFKLIDWRQDFGGSTTTGDIYYDLAKLAGGLVIDYKKIKSGEFDIMVVDGQVDLQIPSITDISTYMRLLQNFVIGKGWNWRKVELLIPIIFWNMAPLHTPPFDKFLWYLGIKIFAELSDPSQ